MCMLQISSQSELSLEKAYEQFGGFEIDLLKSIANSTVRMKFLKVFSQAQEFIEWLQRETKSILHCMLMLYKFAWEVPEQTILRIFILYIELLSTQQCS